jgi:hypothetical protein
MAFPRQAGPGDESDNDMGVFKHFMSRPNELLTGDNLSPER